ncbi:thiamine pyrophosphate-binding protein [Pseudoponticoccus marisrubri]|uniref:Decarboxylase n=1 Tax=Pseudoponticoccus marisrubri TaxID=1685382 RepID=A0A0W7WE82_9RHOB|nr:thiamine pyrophosphate-binding protein [Pseudoponticoccus marisrubri]KUF08963.1 decarboxylase [Pseudoponticoccus marisrubri]
MKIHDAMAEMITREGIRHHFTLLGDANMHFAQRLEALGAQTVHVRHEHSACSMAMSYARATGDVGFCSVTCGPGLTQLATALPAAVRAGIPVVVFAGESPLRSPWYNQMFDQGPLVRACGAEYIAVHSADLLASSIQRAFLSARLDQRPIVVGVPMDLQKAEIDDKVDYRPSREVMPAPTRLRPDPAQVTAAADMIAAADRVVVLGGRGMVRSGASRACRDLAAACSGVLATTLPARGAFCGDPFDMGIAGGFSTALAREVFADVDLVIAVGASVTHHTLDGGKLFPRARTLQVDLAPRGINQGRVVADGFVQGDALAATEALLDALGARAEPGGLRSDALARRIATEAPDPVAQDAEAGTLDPRDVIRVLDEALPKTWEMVNSSGHCSYFAAHMYGRAVENFHTIREFGAIGNGLPYAIGVAAARSDNVVVLFDGDGSFLMHSQELDTIRRHGFRLLVCVLNDGAYGSEIHKLRAQGFGDGGAVFGRGDLAGVARGHGLKGRTITSLGEIGPAIAEFRDTDGAMVLDIAISDRIMSPVMRRAHPPAGR